ncbi:MAG: P-protein [Alphaproteobacteria bacterium MarineAlpha9_Bin4]|nr:prephenate dehydratase [Pelagibacterales bacterium]PPR26715.1 MAG: P-protein [Alphaproteobacteria bacterium MarineAlpha9_Bin4]
MNIKIAYQGRPGAYSHLACLKAFPNADTIACETFEEAFENTHTKKTDISFIPVENSLAGRVADIHNLLPKTKLVITGEFFLKIDHQLLALKTTNLENIKYAVSHFHALAQCRDFLQENKIKPVLGTDTAGAAEDLSKHGNENTAAIASSLAAETYNLKILKKNIQDANHNTTRFFIMKNKLDEKRVDSLKYITSFIFKIRNMPSALYKALGGFASNKVNMLKLESYMIDGAFTATQFFVDIEGHPDDDNVKLAFEELGFFSKEVKILGYYPANEFRINNS